MISIETSIGSFQAVFSEGGLVRLDFPDEGEASLAPTIPSALPTPRNLRFRGDPGLAGEGQGGGAIGLLLQRELNDYLAGRLRRFTVPLDLQGTVFQREAWHHVLEIPYGCTQTYSEVATAMGRPHGARAVGAANGANPVPILVPCHRLVGASGDLTGYGGGIALKRWLLRLESERR